MSDLTVRIQFRRPDGSISDGDEEYDLSSFAGTLPLIGDMILEPGVLQGLDRQIPANRRLWTVVGRVFNPRDLASYVALIVEERQLGPDDHALVPR